MTDAPSVATEAPRTDNGQFQSNEPLTGRAGLEKAAGFEPMERPSSDEKEFAGKDGVREAAAELAESRRKTSDPSGMTTTYDTKMPANRTMTLDQGVEMLTDARNADAAQAQIDSTKALQEEVDALRNPHGAEPTQPQLETEIDVERALASPKIRDAIAERVTAADTERAAYEARVVETGKIAISALAADVPELMSLPLNQWKDALLTMSQREPGRFQQTMARIQAVDQVEQAYQKIKADKTAREHAEFRNYAKSEDARFAALVKGERDMPAIEAEIITMVKDHGIEPHEFFKAGNESKFLRSAAAQKILVDAAKYRLMQKAAKAVPSRAAVPTVQRPGVAVRSNPGAANLQTLNAALSKSGSVKDAAKLLVAKRSTRR